MDANDITQNIYFWLSLAGISVGLFHYTLKRCCNSNCLSLKLCGITVLEREIDHDIKMMRSGSETV